MVSIPEMLGPRQKKRRVIPRQFKILKCIQWSEWNRPIQGADSFEVELCLHLDGCDSETCLVCVSSAQLINYRAFQRAVLKEKGVLLVDEEIEQNIGAWPLHLAEYFWEGA